MFKRSRLLFIGEVRSGVEGIVVRAVLVADVAGLKNCLEMMPAVC